MEEVKSEHEEETVRRPTGCDVAVHRTIGTRQDSLLKSDCHSGVVLTNCFKITIFKTENLSHVTLCSPFQKILTN